VLEGSVRVPVDECFFGELDGLNQSRLDIEFDPLDVERLRID
jgi:hypothetical protein